MDTRQNVYEIFFHRRRAKHERQLAWCSIQVRWDMNPEYHNVYCEMEKKIFKSKRHSSSPIPYTLIKKRTEIFVFWNNENLPLRNGYISHGFSSGTTFQFSFQDRKKSDENLHSLKILSIEVIYICLYTNTKQTRSPIPKYTCKKTEASNFVHVMYLDIQLVDPDQVCLHTQNLPNRRLFCYKVPSLTTKNTS